MTARAPKPILYAIGFGSNIAPAENLPRALALLCARPPVTVLTLSHVWETPPVDAPGPNFYNAVALISFPLDAEHLKQQVLRPIESALGRVRTANPNAPRTIDLDILVAGHRVRDASIWHLAHWAVPLAEVLPNLKHPESGQTLTTIAQQLANRTTLRVVALSGWEIQNLAHGSSAKK